MSKNFELLTHVEGDRGLFQAAREKLSRRCPQMLCRP